MTALQTARPLQRTPTRKRPTALRISVVRRWEVATASRVSTSGGRSGADAASRANASRFCEVNTPACPCQRPPTSAQSNAWCGSCGGPAVDSWSIPNLVLDLS